MNLSGASWLALSLRKPRLTMLSVRGKKCPASKLAAARPIELSRGLVDRPSRATCTVTAQHTAPAPFEREIGFFVTGENRTRGRF